MVTGLEAGEVLAGPWLAAASFKDAVARLVVEWVLWILLLLEVPRRRAVPGWAEGRPSSPAFFAVLWKLVGLAAPKRGMPENAAVAADGGDGRRGGRGGW